MMNEREKLKKALVAAHNKGDKRAAEMFAQRIKSLDTQPAPEPAPQPAPEPAPQPAPDPAPQVDPNQPTPVAQDLASLGDKAKLSAEVLKNAAIGNFVNEETSIDGFIGTLENVLDLGVNTAGDFLTNASKVGSALPLPRYIQEVAGISDEKVLEAQQKFRNVFDYEPRTESGKAIQKQLKDGMQAALQNTGADKLVETAVGKITQVEDATADYLGSRVLAEGLFAAPELLLDTAGGFYRPKGMRVNKKPKDKMVNDASLAVGGEVMKKARKIRNGLYEELNNDGFKFRSGTMQEAAGYVEEQLRKNTNLTDAQIAETMQGTRRRNPFIRLEGGGGRLNNESVGTIEAEKRMLFDNLDYTNGDKVTAATEAARALDNFIGTETARNRLIAPDGSPAKITEQAKEKLRLARKLSGNIIQARDIDEVFQKAANAPEKDRLKNIASSFTNILDADIKKGFYKGVADDMRNIINLKGLPEESKVLRLFGFLRTTPTDAAVNTAKFGRAFSASLRKIAIISPTRAIAEQLFKGDKSNIRAAALVREKLLTGGNGDEIIRTYLKNVPQGKRRSDVLAKYLADPRVNLDEIERTGAKLQKEAIQEARGIRFVNSALTATATPSMNEAEQEEEQQ
jgi:hypothetical protein